MWAKKKISIAPLPLISTSPFACAISIFLPLLLISTCTSPFPCAILLPHPSCWKVLPLLLVHLSLGKWVGGFHGEGFYIMTHPAGPVIRGSWGDLLLRTKLGGRERWGSCANNDTETFWIASRPQCISQAQGLNAQAKGEVQVLISGRGGAIQAKGEVLISGRGGAIEIFSFGSYTGKQELGGIRVWSGQRWRWLRAGTICGCSRSGASVACFWPPFLLGGRGPI